MIISVTPVLPEHAGHSKKLLSSPYWLKCLFDHLTLFEDIPMQERITSKRFHLILWLVLISIAFLSGPTHATEPQKKHPKPQLITLQKAGSWAAICPKVNKKINKGCFLEQTLKSKKGDSPLARLLIGRFASKRQFTAIVILPLGLFLPTGVIYQVDEHKKAKMGFEKCMPDGCMATRLLNQQEIIQLKKGRKLKLTAVQNAKQALTFHFPLKGFTKTYNKAEKFF
ncbi:invasion associated locus B family protein [Magnetococcales bacterium HHB-1]